MINALGLLEVEGMVAAVDAADAMLKAANVRLLSHEVLDPGRLTLVVEGDLADDWQTKGFCTPEDICYGLTQPKTSGRGGLCPGPARA